MIEFLQIMALGACVIALAVIGMVLVILFIWEIRERWENREQYRYSEYGFCGYCAFKTEIRPNCKHCRGTNRDPIPWIDLGMEPDPSWRVE